MYEIDGYIIWYSTKTHTWLIKDKNTWELVGEAGSFSKARKYIAEVKSNGCKID